VRKRTAGIGPECRGKCGNDANMQGVRRANLGKVCQRTLTPPLVATYQLARRARVTGGYYTEPYYEDSP
jgi:hypothetical protein